MGPGRYAVSSVLAVHEHLSSELWRMWKTLAWWCILTTQHCGVRGRGRQEEAWGSLTSYQPVYTASHPDSVRDSVLYVQISK